MSESSPITYFPGDDEEMLEANFLARKSFRDFWYQVSLDFNRIVPALSLAVVKAAFSDDFSDPNSPVEHMFVEGIDFDGQIIKGTLLNQPNALTSISEGDEVCLPLEQLGDWLCVMGDTVYGAYTVQVIRSRMSEAERVAHDEAWGLPFPSPEKVLIPKHDETMERNLAGMLDEQIAEDSEFLTRTLEEGRTMLHLQALNGRNLIVKKLLELGASPTVRCDRGWTPVDYAQCLGWHDVVRTLKAAK